MSSQLPENGVQLFPKFYPSLHQWFSGSAAIIPYPSLRADPHGPFSWVAVIRKCRTCKGV